MDQRMMLVAMMLLILPSISALGKNVLLLFFVLFCFVLKKTLYQFNSVGIVFLEVGIPGSVKKEKGIATSMKSQFVKVQKEC